jgi:uncharacterized protein (DUF2147 family)
MRSSCFMFVLAISFATNLSSPARAAAGSSATPDSPVGLWKTVDDVTGKVKSVVKIWEERGKLYGKVQNLVDPVDPNPTCQDCPGNQKGKPVVGLRILWDLQKDQNGWSGGTILDPESGKTYKCLVSLEDGGKKLKVRGFIGLSLLGRTQYWLRE